MIVSKIEKSKGKQERVLVYPAEGEPFAVTEAELLHFGVYPGAEISEETARELRLAGERSLLRAKGARIASSRMLSRKEVRDRLLRGGADEEAAAETADWLAELGAVDDAAYAGVIVRHYAAMGYGPGRVRQELQRRGVPRPLWEAALAELPDSAGTIDGWIRGKQKGKPLDAAAAKKLTNALLRRGFSWEEIRSALARWGRETEEL